MLIDLTVLKRIAKATPELTIAQFVSVWSEKIEDQRRETERERIASKRATATNKEPTSTNNEQQPPTYTQRESELYRFAERVCGKRCGSFVKTLLVAHRNDIDTTRAIFERAAQAHDPRGFIATAAGRVKKNGTGTEVMGAFDRLDDLAAGGAFGGDAEVRDVTPGSDQGG